MAKHIYILDEHISSSLNGIGTYIRELTGCLGTAGAEVCLVSFNSPVNEFTLCEEEGVRVMQFPFLPGSVYSFYPILLSFFRLYILDDRDTLFVVNHTPCADFLRELRKRYLLSKIVFVVHGMCWCSLFLGDLEKCKAICISGGSLDKGEFETLQEEKRTYDEADKLVVLSRATEAFLSEIVNIPRAKIICLPNGLKDDFVTIGSGHRQALKAAAGVEPGEKLVLYVGRVSETKGCFSLIRCFRKVLKEYPGCRLAVVGILPDSADTLRLSAEFAGKITYTGQISSDQVKNWYRIADIGVLPSYAEQCSYAGIEMMMYGLPVVASDGFGLGDMFRQGVNAEIARIGNRENPEEFEQNLAERILYLLNHPENCRWLGEAARRTYDTAYTSLHMQQAYMKLFFSL